LFPRIFLRGNISARRGVQCLIGTNYHINRNNVFDKSAPAAWSSHNKTAAIRGDGARCFVPHVGDELAALSDDLPNMPELARARFTDGTERLVAGFAKLVKMLGTKNADALAWSATAEMAGALALSRAVFDRDTSKQILCNSRAMVRSRIGLDRPFPR
jgi:hypothetical protein